MLILRSGYFQRLTPSVRSCAAGVRGRAVVQQGQRPLGVSNRVPSCGAATGRVVLFLGGGFSGGRPLSLPAGTRQVAGVPLPRWCRVEPVRLRRSSACGARLVWGRPPGPRAPACGRCGVSRPRGRRQPPTWVGAEAGASP